jgi:hypothetical protein
MQTMILAWCALLPFLVGCASSVMPSGYLSHPEATRQAGMNKLWIADEALQPVPRHIQVNLFSAENAAGKNPAIDEKTKVALLQAELIGQLKKGGKNASDSNLDFPADEPYLVLDGVFAQLNPGSRALRYWVGCGAGRSLVEVEVKVQDPRTGTCAEFSVAKSKWIGVWGGDSNKFIDDAIRDIATVISRRLCSP